MSELRDLYREVILDHNRRPRNFGPLDNATHTAEGHNPLCGDNIRLFLRIDGDRIQSLRFEGNGCAISKASASIMTSGLQGKTVEEATALFHRFHDMVTGMGGPAAVLDGKLAVFSGVSEFPARVKCASLAWHTLRAALNGGGEVTSE